ncbi:hypothetical protein [Streptomyces sp. NPDC127574]|uniref:hypothetical protein n=1 Tax=Streptomyces sp. NPDC127574 TaxID=3345401 RepID=UPI0036339F4B
MPQVPAGTERGELAQQLADHLRNLTRAGTGERYPAAAEVFLTSGGVELREAGKEVTFLLVQGWAERAWHREAEWRLVVADFFEAVTRWFLDTFPQTASRPVACTPVVAPVSEALVRLSDFAAHTAGPLPPGWDEKIAWHRGLLPLAPRS